MTPFMAMLQPLTPGAIWQVGAAWLRVGPPLVAGFSALWCVAVDFDLHAPAHAIGSLALDRRKHIAPGTHTINETPWDESLPLGWGPTGTGELQSQLIEFLRDADTDEKREHILKILDESEWLFLSSGRSWQNIPRWPDKWPMTSRFYYALWSGELGWVRVREFTSYPQVGAAPISRR